MALGGFMMFLMGLFSLVYNRKHFLVMLLSMELVMLGLFTVLFTFMMIYMEVLMFFLVIVVCEASLGLSVLVMCVFHYGMDLIMSDSMLKC